MADARTLDRAFHFIMTRMVDTGYAPHYTELASELGCAVEEGRLVLRDLMASGIPAWLHPGTDYIASFPPLNAFPTQYRITVDGRQNWFAQCGFEALGACWLFPGRSVRVDAPCLDCNDPIAVEMRDGELVGVEPAGTVGHLNEPWGWWKRGPVEDRAFR